MVLTAVGFPVCFGLGLRCPIVGGCNSSTLIPEQQSFLGLVGFSKELSSIVARPIVAIVAIDQPKILVVAPIFLVLSISYPYSG